MEGSATAVGGRATRVSTLAEAYLNTVADYGDRNAIRLKGDELQISWSELDHRARRISTSLAELGVKKGDTVAIMLGNRPEFHIVDIAVMMLGGVAFSLYQTLAPEQIEYVVSDSGARVAIIEQAYAEQFRSASLPDIEHVVVIDGDGTDGAQTLADLESAEPADYEALAAQIGPDDLLTLIYTSGTTGPPKGVQLTHRNLVFAVAAIDGTVEFPEGSRVISWLPAAHIAERAAHHYLPIIFGFSITSCPNPRDVLAYLPEVRPNWFFAVPRIWEKLKSGIETMIANQPAEQREAAERALAAAIKKVQLEQAGEPVPEELAAAVAQADEEMFSKLRAMFGFDALEAVNVGAAPTPASVIEFFHAIGVPLSELWGMSETCGAGTVNPPDKIKIGTVGPPTKGIEIKLAEDGEVLLRGPVVMTGYRNQPEKTAETIDPEGWLHTGDIGEFDEDGYLKIVDRKKELIISAAGKNMSPANIEATVKSASPLIGQACCIGDARPFNTALITLDPDFAPMWAGQNGIEGKSLEELAGEEKVVAAVAAGIEEGNAKLARVEQIKKFTIVEGDWPPGGDELTPTMKLKRKPIAEKYADEIEAMYGPR